MLRPMSNMLMMCQMKLLVLDWVMLNSPLQIELEKKETNHVSVLLHIVQHLGYDVRHSCLGHSIHRPLLRFTKGPVSMILPRNNTAGTVTLEAEGREVPATFEAVLFWAEFRVWGD